MPRRTAFAFLLPDGVRCRSGSESSIVRSASGFRKKYKHASFGRDPAMGALKEVSLTIQIFPV